MRVKLNGHGRVKLNGHTGSPAVRRGRGQPTLYRPEYCDGVVEFCAQGYSVTAFAGHLGIDRATLTNWGHAHPEFFAAVSEAKAQRLLHWERLALDIAKVGGTGSRATMVVFGLKNMGGDEWSDKQLHEIAGKDGSPINLMSVSVTPQDLAHARQLLAHHEDKP